MTTPTLRKTVLTTTPTLPITVLTTTPIFPKATLPSVTQAIAPTPSSTSFAPDLWGADSTGSDAWTTFPFFAPAPMVGISESYECQDGNSNPAVEWGDSKKAWCCQHENLGCWLLEGVVETTTQPFEQHYDCRTDELRQEFWPDSQKAWCCAQEHVGCVTATTQVLVTDDFAAPTTPKPFDCAVGLSRFDFLWSDQKKSWCCFYQGMGCSGEDTTLVPIWMPTTTPLGDFDCQAGLDNWQRGWSSHKKDWCCAHAQAAVVVQLHEGFGCPTIDQYNCISRQLVWSDGETKWCCANKGIGCPTTSKSQTHDCLAGYPNGEDLWSDVKKAWCCDHEGVGCRGGTSQPAAVAPAAAYDCQAGLSNWQEGWTQTKKDWCSVYGYDCTDHFEHWPPEKENFCCIVQGVGCPLIQQKVEYRRAGLLAVRQKVGTSAFLAAASVGAAACLGFFAALVPFRRIWASASLRSARAARAAENELLLQP